MARFNLLSLVALLILLQAVAAVAITRLPSFTIQSALDGDTVKMLPDELLQSQGIPMVNGDKAGKRELWRFVASNNNGHLRITNPSTRLWLVADKQSMADVFGMPKSEASHWRVEAVLGKPYVIIRLGDSEYVWTRLGDRIIVDTYIGHPAQQWTLTPVPEEFGCF